MEAMEMEVPWGILGRKWNTWPVNTPSRTIMEIMMPQGKCHYGALRERNCWFMNNLEKDRDGLFPRTNAAADRFGKRIIALG
jgi:hypothetical protein